MHIAIIYGEQNSFKSGSLRMYKYYFVLFRKIVNKIYMKDFENFKRYYVYIYINARSGYTRI